MPKIIKDGDIVEDDCNYIDPPRDFHTVTPTTVTPQPPCTEGAAMQSVIVSLDHWLSQRTQLLAANKPVGIWLEGHVDVSLVVDDLLFFDIIAVYFPSFSDGRGFSLGNQLRERYTFQGELRAIGNLLPDQMYYLHRCGFNAVVVANPKDLHLARKALTDFSNNYQEAWGDDKPIFRCR